jgi:hypothetical protein
MRLATLIAVLAAAGCGPTLKRSVDFTPDKVRETLFADSCGLQRYFDAAPPALKLVVDQNTSVDPTVAWGRATYHLTHTPQALALRRLLRRLYRRVVLTALGRGVQLDVRYQIRQGRRQMPIGAETVIRGLSPEPQSLPYHPCLGAFVFGQHHYALRRRLVGAR